MVGGSVERIRYNQRVKGLKRSGLCDWSNILTLVPFHGFVPSQYHIVLILEPLEADDFIETVLKAGYQLYDRIQILIIVLRSVFVILITQ